MANKFTKEQIVEFKEAFSLFDKNNDGKITTNQLGTVMRTMGSNPTKAQIEDLTNDLNTDGEGTIDFYEFLSIMARMIKEDDFEKEFFDAFKSFDINGTGNISIEDFRKALLNLKISDEEINEMIKLVNPNGLIDYEEFLRKIISQ